jgi:hypothetical protein
MNHQLDILFHDLTTFKSETEKRHNEMKLHIQGYAEHNKHLLETIHSLMDRVLHDVEGKDYKESLTNLHQAVAEGNQAVLMSIPHAVHSSKISLSSPSFLGIYSWEASLTTFALDLKEHSPRWGFIIFIVLAGQVMLFVSYVIYKRRKSRQPKKYL